VILRPHTADDVSAILDVWYRASLIAHPFLSEEFLASERREIEAEWLPIAETTVCEIDGRVVGFLSLVGDEVGAIFVDPRHQRRGAGRALMDHARTVRNELEVAVFEENAIGRSFYDGYGFEFVERRTNEETGHPELRLRLGTVGERL